MTRSRQRFSYVTSDVTCPTGDQNIQSLQECSLYLDIKHSIGALCIAMVYGKLIARQYYFLIPFLLLLFAESGRTAGLQTQFGVAGLRRIQYNQTVLMDADSNGQDAFTIGEYRLISRDGAVKNLWGENTVARSWNVLTSTLTWNYPWGTVRTRYSQSGDTLKLSVSVTNTSREDAIEGLNIYPCYIHFPQMPAGFVSLNYPQIKFGLDGPGITMADYGSGLIAIEDQDFTKPLYTGFSSTGTLAYHVLIGSTYNSGQPKSWPKNTRPIPAGASDQYTVLIRFGSGGLSLSSVAANTYARYRSAWPFLLNWPDRHPIGALFLSSSGSGDIHRKAGFPTNPRRYFNDPKVNVTTSAGLQAFQRRVLAGADGSIKVIKDTGGHGMITWDIEGEEYPQETSYVCDPEKLAQLSPEMESAVTDAPYSGMKLADAFFKKFKDAGLKTGVCIRPQNFEVAPDGSASQNFLDAEITDENRIDAAVSAELIRKITYARNRWGITMAYIDSAVNKNGGALNAAVFRTVVQAFPDMLLIPEESTPAHLAYSSPWAQLSNRGFAGTPANNKLAYPEGFSSIYVADAPRNLTTGKLAQYDQLVQGVKQGDILIFRGFFDDRYFNDQVKAIYADAHSSALAGYTFRSNSKWLIPVTMAGAITTVASVLGLLWTRTKRASSN